MRKALWLFLLAMLVCFIFYNSYLPAEQSHGASQLLVSIINDVERMLGMTPSQGNIEYNLRKFAHLFEYFLLGVVLCNVYASFGVSRRTSTGYILFLGIFIGLLDESIQLFAPGRTALVTDIIIDFAGVSLAWLCYETWHWSKS